VNTTDSAVRLTHIPTGIVVRIQDDRSQHKVSTIIAMSGYHHNCLIQHQNRSKALKILRAKLYEMKRTEAEMVRRKERKEQVGSGERHERIRTYHYLQDRVTDHRVNISIHGIEGFLEGKDGLASIIEQLQAHEEATAISNLLSKSP